MKKFLFLFLAAIVFSFSVKAYYLSPATGAMTKGGSKAINIIANPGANSDYSVASIRMTLVNATVTSFTPSSAILDTIGQCPPELSKTSDHTYTDNTICFDVGNAPPFINNGDSLGTFTVTWANINGISTITKTAGSLYFNGTDNASLGQVGLYTLGTIPATPFAPDIMPEIYLAAGGLAMIFLGIYLFQNLKDEKKNFNEDVSF